MWRMLVGRRLPTGLNQTKLGNYDSGFSKGVAALPRTVAPLAEPAAPVSDEANVAIAIWI
jgi:hypothetical protein